MRRSRHKSIVILFASCLWALSTLAYGSDKDPFDSRVAEADAVGKKEFAILPYYPTYILPLATKAVPTIRSSPGSSPAKPTKMWK